MDGETMGEIVFRGNIAMKGLPEEPQGHAGSVAGGWFHSGDLAVQYPDGYVKIKDRRRTSSFRAARNISVHRGGEDVLYRPIWTCWPHAVIRGPPGSGARRPRTSWSRNSRADHAPRPPSHCKSTPLARCRATWCSANSPKTSTGKIQKFELREARRLGMGDV